MIKNLVSIIIPVYNNIEYLKDSLSSVVSQTYPYIEIIVVDDGSKKHNQIIKICKQFKNKIKIIKLARNTGVSSALNKGILASKGQYINWLSHDDLFTPTKIDDQMKFLRGSSNSISITNFIILDTEKNIKTRSKQHEKDFINFKENILTRDIYNFCTFLIPQILFEPTDPKDIAQKTKLFLNKKNKISNKKIRKVQNTDFIDFDRAKEMFF
jgi:glycosyltransferase involved in cell wall biosynthesis